MPTSGLLDTIDPPFVFDGKITPPIPNGPQLLSRISALIDTCRTARVPVIYLQTCAISGHPYTRDTHGWEIHPQIARRSHEKVFLKVGPSAFENPELDPLLQELGTHEVIVCGIWSEGCVAYTCNAAIELGYDLCLVADGHSTVRSSESDALEVVSEENHKLKCRNARVLDVQDTLNHLRAE